MARSSRSTTKFWELIFVVYDRRNGAKHVHIRWDWEVQSGISSFKFHLFEELSSESYLDTLFLIKSKFRHHLQQAGSPTQPYRRLRTAR